MKYVTKISAVAAAGATALALAIGSPAFAQAADPIDPGVYMWVHVHPLAPFLTPTFSMANINNAEFALPAALDPLTPAQLLEVRQRCSVIVNTPAGRPGGDYTASTVAFCGAIFAWVAANRATAPVTDAALAAATP